MAWSRVQLTYSIIHSLYKYIAYECERVLFCIYPLSNFSSRVLPGSQTLICLGVCLQSERKSWTASIRFSSLWWVVSSIFKAIPIRKHPADDRVQGSKLIDWCHVAMRYFASLEFWSILAVTRSTTRHDEIRICNDVHKEVQILLDKSRCHVI